MSKVLVTGGAGFVGSHLVKRLVEDGARVTVLDDMSMGREENLGGIGGELCQIVVASVTDREMVNKLVSEAEVVFHLAARNIIASTRNPGEDFSTNIGGTLNVLLAAREAGVKRVIYASSASVYGNPHHVPVCEDDPVRFLSPYAVSKFAGEAYCQVFYKSYELPITIMRYSNVYGPGQVEGVVPRFLRALACEQPLPVHGDGQQTRDFTWVADAVEATLLAAKSRWAVGEVFNVGTGIETSVIELVRLMAGPKVVLEFVDRRDIDNIRRRVLNIEKARKGLHWRPVVTLQEGLRRLTVKSEKRIVKSG